MKLAAEVEIGKMYINACEALPQIIALIKMGHQQQRTPMKTGNLAAHSILTKYTQKRIKKVIDMCFNWIRCQYTQGHFRYYWRLGKQKLV